MNATPVNVFAEATPNPNTMKFMLDRFILTEGNAEYTSPESASGAPLVQKLFELPFVQSVFVSANFVTLTKGDQADWYEYTTPVRELIKDFVRSGEPFFISLPERPAKQDVQPAEPYGEVEKKIIDLLEEYVRPAVERDGGAIHFKSFDKGVVTVLLQGSCSGCPSSAFTLKAGIETLLKRMIPEVTDVVAAAG